MSDAAFESKVSGIFKRMEQRLGGRLATEKSKAENLQSQDTRRVAFILTEAIEAELKPAVKEALASYDDAISRPMTQNERWEHILTQQIGQAVDSAVKLALALDAANHPWKPLLSDEAPKLRTRLVTSADEHFTRLGKMGARRRRGADAGADWTMRIVMLAVGALVGFLLAKVMH
ncbi:MAG: hypothetical protein E7812_13770 [Phenylobacterium sp.]|nr:MAG: hypothetical protein E7812_13770 [Phenylobacterium sp.]